MKFRLAHRTRVYRTRYGWEFHCAQCRHRSLSFRLHSDAFIWARRHALTCRTLRALDQPVIRKTIP